MLVIPAPTTLGPCQSGYPLTRIRSSIAPAIGTTASIIGGNQTLEQRLGTPLTPRQPATGLLHYGLERKVSFCCPISPAADIIGWMTELNDYELLGEFARTRSDTAFAALVARYINLVYSTALRFDNNADHAQDITQAVFVILGQKAGQLRPGIVLSGWLYQTARLTVHNFARAEIRRQLREQEVYMQSIQNEPESAAWEQIAPLLDDAMGALGETDRNAIALRFFENKTAAEAAAALKMSEAAAHKRTSRALEKLRKYFSKRGVILTTTLIAGAVAANSVQAAPAGLAASVASVAAAGTTLSTTIALLVKGTMNTMKWMQIKFALGVGSTVVAAGLAATVALSETKIAGADRLSAQEIAKESQAAYAALSSYSDTGATVADMGGMKMETTFDIRLQRPNLYRIQWGSANGFGAPGSGTVWSDGTGDYLATGAIPKRKEENMQMALASATGISSSASSTVPGTFFEQNWGDQLKVLASAHPAKVKVSRDKDEKVGAIDCYVLVSQSDPMALPNNAGNIGKITRRLFLGKADHLIHRMQTRMEGGSHNGTPFSQTGTVTFDEKHENIVVNKQFAPGDFAQ